MSATEGEPEAMDTTPVEEETPKTEETAVTSEKPSENAAETAPTAPESTPPEAAKVEEPAKTSAAEETPTPVAPISATPPTASVTPAPVPVELPKVTPQPSTTPVALAESIQKVISEEKEAVTIPKAKPDIQSLPTRQYLDQCVVPILLQSLTALSKERPADPIDFLAAYLMKNKHLFQK